MDKKDTKRVPAVNGFGRQNGVIEKAIIVKIRIIIDIFKSTEN